MASEEALRLKAQWMEMPAEFFETPTFGDIEVGQRFIDLPHPGDNSGHGGFMGARRIFTKTHQRIDSIGGLPYGIPHGRAVNNLGTTSDFPDSMSVIRLI